MDLILENIQPGQIQVFKKMAKILNIRTKTKGDYLDESQEDKAMLLAMKEAKSGNVLDNDEKSIFLKSLNLL